MTAPLKAGCDCGLPRAYADCCGRYHAGPLHLQAPNAQALMRSRYSAFVRDLGDYLLATWHPRTRPAALEPHPPGLRWLGLEVRCPSAPPGRPKALKTPSGGHERSECGGHGHSLQDDDHATVEFVARSKLGGKAQRLHETSRFVREGGCWFYVDGDLR
jgi:SEC-C motif-containing protein